MSHVVKIELFEFSKRFKGTAMQFKKTTAL